MKPAFLALILLTSACGGRIYRADRDLLKRLEASRAQAAFSQVLVIGEDGSLTHESRNSTSRRCVEPSCF